MPIANSIQRKIGNGDVAVAAEGAIELQNSNVGFMTFGGLGHLKNGGQHYLNSIMEFGIGSEEWTWRGGVDTVENNSVFGTTGVEAATNAPGGRERAGHFVASDDSMWMFGGWGPSNAGNNLANLHFADMWRLNPVNRQWTFMGGHPSSPQGTNQSGIYGTMGVPSAANWPGARRTTVCWTDNNGDFWIYGGFGYDENGDLGGLSDLWRFDYSLGQWCWENGSKVINEFAVFETILTETPTQHPGTVYATDVSFCDSNNNLFFFGGFGAVNSGAQGYLNAMWRYNTTTGEWSWRSGTDQINQPQLPGTQGVGSAANNPGGLIRAVCVGTQTNDRMYIFGGRGYDSASGLGLLNTLWRFNTVNGNWTWMNGSTTINQGPVGHADQYNDDPSYSPGGRESAHSFGLVNDDELWVYGGNAIDSLGDTGFVGDLWRWQLSTNQWTFWRGGHERLVFSDIIPLGDATDTSYPYPRYYGAYWWNPNRANEFWIWGGNATYNLNDNAVEAADTWLFITDASMDTDTHTGQWGWMQGAVFNPPLSIYGTTGVPSVNNSPGGRNGCFCIQNGDDVYIIGGHGYGNIQDVRFLNEVWKYKISTKEWTFLRGNQNTVNAEGDYGTVNVEADSNVFPSRAYGVCWLDGNYIYLFGGEGYGTVGSSQGNYNDTWRYNITNNRFTYLKGPDQADQPGNAVGGTGVFDPAHYPGSRRRMVYGWKSENYLWLFGGEGYGTNTPGILRDMWSYDPVSNQWRRTNTWSGVNAPGVYATKGEFDGGVLGSRRDYCLVHDTVNKHLLVFGGYGHDVNNAVGELNDLWLFDTDPDSPNYFEWKWLHGLDTINNVGRYQPEDIERFDSYPGGRESSVCFIDHLQRMWIWGGVGYSEVPALTVLQDLWMYNQVNDNFTWVDGSKENQPLVGIYGTIDVPGPDIVPGAVADCNAFAFMSPFLAGDKVTIDGEDFEFSVDWQLGDTPAETAHNLMIAINLQLNPDVEAEIDGSNSSKIILTAVPAGDAGNDHTLTKTDTGRGNFILTQFTGGLDANQETGFEISIDENKLMHFVINGAEVATVPYDTLYDVNRGTFRTNLKTFLKKAAL